MLTRPATAVDAAKIDALIDLEYNAHKYSKQSRVLDGREALEAVRLTTQSWEQYHRRLAEFEASLVPKPTKAPAAEVKPAPSKAESEPSLDHRLEVLRRHRKAS